MIYFDKTGIPTYQTELLCNSHRQVQQSGQYWALLSSLIDLLVPRWIQVLNYGFWLMYCYQAIHRLLLTDVLLPSYTQVAIDLCTATKLYTGCYWLMYCYQAIQKVAINWCTATKLYTGCYWLMYCYQAVHRLLLTDVLLPSYTQVAIDLCTATKLYTGCCWLMYCYLAVHKLLLTDVLLPSYTQVAIDWCTDTKLYTGCCWLMYCYQAVHKLLFTVNSDCSFRPLLLNMCVNYSRVLTGIFLKVNIYLGCCSIHYRVLWLLFFAQKSSVC